MTPLPTLTSIGTLGAETVLVDLERLGSVGLQGDQDACRALITHMAVELAHCLLVRCPGRLERTLMRGSLPGRSRPTCNESDGPAGSPATPWCWPSSAVAASTCPNSSNRYR